MNNIKKFESMINLIRQIPEEEAPKGLVDRVCSSLQPKKLSVWKRIYRSVMTPCEISFTPGKLIPVAAACTVLFFVVFSFLTHFDHILTHLDRIVPHHADPDAACVGRAVRALVSDRTTSVDLAVAGDDVVVSDVGPLAFLDVPSADVGDGGLERRCAVVDCDLGRFA